MRVPYAALALVSLASAQVEQLGDGSFSGYLIDLYCWDLPDSIALDGADLKTSPDRHTVHCMRDIQSCRDNGFAVLDRSANAEQYSIKYRLDAEGNAKALAYVDSTSKTADVVVTLRGNFKDGTASNVEIVDYEPPSSGDDGGDAAAPAPSKAPVSSGRAPEASLVAHFVLMAVSWGALLPWGVALAARARGVPGVEQGAWFKAHRALQTVGWVLQLLGFAAAVIYAETVTAHFVTAHTWVGIATVALGTLQPLNALLRPHAPADGEAKSGKRAAWEVLHKGSGYLAIIGGIVALCMGVDLLAKKGYSTAAVAAAAALVGVGLAPVLMYAVATFAGGGTGVSLLCVKLFGARAADEAPPGKPALAS